jgi:hypothetical protein
MTFRKARGDVERRRRPSDEGPDGGKHCLPLGWCLQDCHGAAQGLQLHRQGAHELGREPQPRGDVKIASQSPSSRRTAGRKAAAPNRRCNCDWNKPKATEMKTPPGKGLSARNSNQTQSSNDGTPFRGSAKARTADVYSSSTKGKMCVGRQGSGLDGQAREEADGREADRIRRPAQERERGVRGAQGRRAKGREAEPDDCVRHPDAKQLRSVVALEEILWVRKI